MSPVDDLPNIKNIIYYEAMKAFSNTKNIVMTTRRRMKIRQGARDFAVRFKDVMRDLANG